MDYLVCSHAVRYRFGACAKFAARNEDDLVHLAAGTERAVSQQVSVAQKLEWFDRWGKTLTIVDGLFALVLVAIMLFTAWRESLAVVK